MSLKQHFVESNFISSMIEGDLISSMIMLFAMQNLKVYVATSKNEALS